MQGKGITWLASYPRTWRDELTPEQARQIEADHGEQMRRFGYLA